MRPKMSKSEKFLCPFLANETKRKLSTTHFLSKLRGSPTYKKHKAERS